MSHVLETASQLEKSLDELKSDGVFYKSFELYGASSSVLGCYSGIKPVLMAESPEAFESLNAKMRDTFGNDFMDAFDKNTGFSVPVIATATTKWTNDYVVERQGLENLPEYQDLYYVVMNANVTAYEFADDGSSRDDIRAISDKYISGMKSDVLGLAGIQEHARKVMVQEFGEDFVNKLESGAKGDENEYANALDSAIQDYQDGHEAGVEDEKIDEKPVDEQVDTEIEDKPDAPESPEDESETETDTGTETDAPDSEQESHEARAKTNSEITAEMFPDVPDGTPSDEDEYSM